MNINFSNIGIGTGAFGIGDQAKVEGQNVETQKPTAASRDVRLSSTSSFDVLKGSEPITDVPASAMARDDGLGRLVSSAFNLPPPPMPDFAD